MGTTGVDSVVGVAESRVSASATKVSDANVVWDADGLAVVITVGLQLPRRKAIKRIRAGLEKCIERNILCALGGVLAAVPVGQRREPF